jgi:hypothetical protein
MSARLAISPSHLDETPAAKRIKLSRRLLEKGSLLEASRHHAAARINLTLYHDTLAPRAHWRGVGRNSKKALPQNIQWL